MSFIRGFCDEILKSAAEVVTPLLPHQQRVVERIKEQPGLLVAHGLGSGKTLSSIASVTELKPRYAQVLTPASLMSNYLKEVDKHVKGKFPAKVKSLQTYARKGRAAKGDLLVVDEAHWLRTPGSQAHKMVGKAKSRKKMLLTATPIYNKPSDIASLVNLTAGEKVLPMGQAFEERHVRMPSMFLSMFGAKPSIQHKEELRDAFKKWVDYYASRGENFPDVTEERIITDMTQTQTDLHDAAWHMLPFGARLKLFAGVLPEKQDLIDLNAFQAQSRQIADTEAKFTKKPAKPTPKIKRAVEELVNKKQKAVVYSNFLQPLEEYSKELRRNKVKHKVFSGEIPKEEKDRIIKKYNSNKLDALLVSSAGSEGLDLKGTRLVQILEPHWNDEKINQIVGRAVRYGSHAHLPKGKRNVHIQKFEARPLNRKRGIEQVLYDLSEEKTHLNKQIEALLEAGQ